MKKNYVIFLLILSPLLCITKAKAQLNSELELFMMYDDNPFKFDSSTALLFNGLNLAVQYDLDSGKYSLNFESSFAMANELSNARFSDNAFSFIYNNYLDENEIQNLRLKFGFNHADNSGDYNQYNNNSFSIFSAYAYELTPASELNGGYSGKYKNYYNEVNYSNSEHVLFLAYKQYFESNTSIKFELNYGSKIFSNSFMGISSNSKGKGKGMGMGSSSFNQTTNQTISQIMASIRLTQSLAENTGLSFTYGQSWNADSEYLNSFAVNPDLIFEKEIYDDPYSYESREIELKATHYISESAKIQALGYYYNKNYSYKTDFSNSDSLDFRKDEDIGYGINFEKTFNDEFLIFSGMKLNASAVKIKNTSNINFFNYSSYELKLAIQFNFNSLDI